MLKIEEGGGGGWTDGVRAVRNGRWVWVGSVYIGGQWAGGVCERICTGELPGIIASFTCTTEHFSFSFFSLLFAFGISCILIR